MRRNPTPSPDLGGVRSVTRCQGHGVSSEAPQCGQLLAALSFRPLRKKPLARCPNIPPMFPPHLGHGNRLTNAAHATSITAAAHSVKRLVFWSSCNNGGRAKPRKTIANRTAFDQSIRRFSLFRIVSLIGRLSKLTRCDPTAAGRGVSHGAARFHSRSPYHAAAMDAKAIRRARSHHGAAGDLPAIPARPRAAGVTEMVREGWNAELLERRLIKGKAPPPLGRRRLVKLPARLARELRR